MSQCNKLKTLKDVEEIDRERSGCLTPKDGKEYNHSIGEPKYYTSYKVGSDNLRSLALEYVKHYEQMMETYSGDYDRELYIFNAGKRASIIDFFNLEE